LLRKQLIQSQRQVTTKNGENDNLLQKINSLSTTLAETTQDLRGVETKLANQNQIISKLEEDKVSLTGINQAYREFVEELTEPGMAEEIIKKTV